MEGPTLPGIGETFGESVDAVLRRPAAAVVPLLADAGFFLLGLLALSVEKLPALDGPGYGEARFGFGISTALPSLADTLDAPSAVRAFVAGSAGVPPIVLVAAFVAVVVPTLAFVEGGFVAVLHGLYVEDEAGPLPSIFLPAAKARFVPLLLYRATLAAGFLAGYLLAGAGDAFRNTAAGMLALRFLLVFAPYAIVVDGAGFLESVKRSVLAVVDHVATCLVLLLFLLLTSGGVAAVLTPFAPRYGALAILAAILVYAPLGTILSLFVLRVWLSFRPKDPLPQPAKAPAAEKAAVGA